jgi:hypothetical protein
VDDARSVLYRQTNDQTQFVNQKVDNAQDGLSLQIDGVAQSVHQQVDGVKDDLNGDITHAAQDVQSRLAATEERLRDHLDSSEQNLQEQISRQQIASLARLVATQKTLTDRIDGSERSLKKHISSLGLAAPHDLKLSVARLKDAAANFTLQSQASSMEVRRNVTETFIALEQKELQNRAVATAGMQDLTAKLKSTERAMTARMRDEVGMLAYQNSKDAAHLQHDVESLAHQGQAAAPLQIGWCQGLVLCTCASALTLALASCLQGTGVRSASIQLPLLSHDSAAPVSDLQPADSAVRAEEGVVVYTQGQQQQQQQRFCNFALVPVEERLARMEHEVSRLATITTSHAMFSSSQGAPSSVQTAREPPVEFSLEDSTAESAASADDAASSQGSSRGWLVSG